MSRIYDRVYDVVVAGGGVSGCAAALSARRAGADVLLIEQNGYLGGALTACGVGPMMTFHSGQKQIIKGFMQEIVSELVLRGYSPGHITDTKQYTDTITPFDAEGLKLILDEKMAEAGVKVLFHTFVGAVCAEKTEIKYISVSNKDGINNIYAKVFIDATADADIAAFAGVATTKGRESDSALQPMTMTMKYCGVDTEKLRNYILSDPERFPALTETINLYRENIPMDIEGFEEEMKCAKARGEVSIGRENVLIFATGRDGEYIINSTRIINRDGTDAFDLSMAEIEGRRQSYEMDRFLRKNVPGFENALLEFTGPNIGVRGTRQIVGVYTLSADDILSYKKFDDCIAHSAYPIDIHNPKGEGTTSYFLKEKGRGYSIPYSIMVCPSIDNLIVTGRCVSATFEAQAAIRTTPTVGAMGQAAGIAAALAVESKTNVRDIDIKALRESLVKAGAYLEDV